MRDKAALNRFDRAAFAVIGDFTQLMRRQASPVAAVLTI
jgi:hypothetical protein